jgi:selenocysteine lyase/cysteine desulfurase
VNSKEVAQKLGKRGILVWNGDFYAVKAVEVYGLVEQGGLIRAGMLMYNTREEVDRLVEGVEETAGENR